MVQRASRPIGFEHIAVIGMGCRFPGGVNDPDDYWNLLTTGGNGVADIPPDRWDAEKAYDPDPAASGKMYVKRGAFIEDVRGFDPYSFGITPREAVAIDPQQRLLLEVSWEALENAGIPPDSLRGSEGGVFVGITNDDYAARCRIWSELESIDNFTFTGVARSVASGRIAYAFDLSGPAMQLDTACSSSLMAVYQACQSLSLGECDLALAGGVRDTGSSGATHCRTAGGDRRRLAGLRAAPRRGLVSCSTKVPKPAALQRALLFFRSTWIILWPKVWEEPRPPLEGLIKCGGRGAEMPPEAPGS